MGMCGSKKDQDGKQTNLLQVIDEHTGGINCMAVSDDGSVLATGSEDWTARLWTTKTEVCECIGILKGHEDYINCVVIEETFVLTGSADKTIRKWDMGTCDCVHVFRGHTSLLNRLICTGDFIFSSSYDRTARCWDFDTGECIRVFSGHKRGVYPLIFIPNDDDNEEDSMGANKDILITGSADFTARSWSFETGKCLFSFKHHTGAITCMATDPLGRTLLTGSTDQTVVSWDTATGKVQHVFKGHGASVICLTVVNKMLYTGSSDLTGKSWVVEFGDCTRTYKGHKHTVSCIRYNKGLVFTACGDGIIRCFEARSAALKAVMEGHELSVNCMQIVEGRLFTGSHDHTLRIWDISDLREDGALNVDVKKSTKGGNKTEPMRPAHVGPENAAPARKIMIDDEDENMNAQTELNGNIGTAQGNRLRNNGFV